jgi:hypothetical protein
MDTNSTPSTTLSGSFKFDSTTGSLNGRGTMNIVVGGQTFAAAFYIVNANSMFFLLENPVGIDNPLLLGQILRQWTGSFSALSLSGPAVFYSNGLSTTSTSTTKALIGQFSADGLSTLSGEMAVSDGGTPTPLVTFANASYSVASNGRGVFNSSATGQVIFYLATQNSGFLLWPTGGGVGMIEPQTLPAGNLKTSDMVGRYLVSGTQQPVPNGGAFSGYVTLDGDPDANAVGDWTSMVDVSALSPTTDLYNAGTVAVSSATRGRVTMTVTVPANYNQIIYAATPDRLLVLDVDPSYYNSGASYQATGFWEK